MISFWGNQTRLIKPPSPLPLQPQQLRQFRAVELDQHGALDIKGGGGFVAARPAAHTLGCLAVAGDVDLLVAHVVVLEEDAGAAAGRAPTGAVHDHVIGGVPFLRRFFHCGLRKPTLSHHTFKGLAFDTCQHLEQLVVIRLLVQVVHLGKADHAVFVDDKDGALAVTLGPQHAKQVGDLAVRVEIAQQGVGDAAQALRPGCQTRYTVNADTQDLGIYPVEPVERDLVGRDLAGSDRRPGQREERHCDVLLPAVIAQAHRFVQVAFQFKFRSGLSNLQGHMHLLFPKPVNVPGVPGWLYCTLRRGRLQPAGGACTLTAGSQRMQTNGAHDRITRTQAGELPRRTR